MSLAILDLQGLEEKPESKKTQRGGGPHSGASKNCGNVELSFLSLLLCG